MALVCDKSIWNILQLAMRFFFGLARVQGSCCRVHAIIGELTLFLIEAAFDQKILLPLLLQLKVHKNLLFPVWSSIAVVVSKLNVNWTFCSLVTDTDLKYCRIVFTFFDFFPTNGFHVFRRVYYEGHWGFRFCGFGYFLDRFFGFCAKKTSVFRFCCSLRFADFPLFSIWFLVFAKNTNGFSDFDIRCGFQFFPVRPVWIPVSLWSERQLRASTDLE